MLEKRGIEELHSEHIKMIPVNSGAEHAQIKGSKPSKKLKVSAKFKKFYIYDKELGRNWSFGDVKLDNLQDYLYFSPSKIEPIFVEFIMKIYDFE